MTFGPTTSTETRLTNQYTLKLSVSNQYEQTLLSGISILVFQFLWPTKVSFERHFRVGHRETILTRLDQNVVPNRWTIKTFTNIMWRWLRQSTDAKGLKITGTEQHTAVHTTQIISYVTILFTRTVTVSECFVLQKYLKGEKNIKSIELPTITVSDYC